jgi:exopolysaccharide/PEP-CTERM locus tyrosine autokinase
MNIFTKEMEWDLAIPRIGGQKRVQEFDDPGIHLVKEPNNHQERPVNGNNAGQHANNNSMWPGFSRFNLDLARLEKSGMVTPNLGNNQIIEEYRYIKRPILATAFDINEETESPGNQNVVVVTSTLPGEGKTFSSLNLAMSVAMEKDKTVLLVDADLEQTGLTQLLDLSRKTGLSDYLTNPDLSLDGLMLKSENVPKLTILPSGESRRDAAEILASERMRYLVQELAWRYSDRLIIIDAPPLLASSSASILTHLAGQTIMVVASSETSTDSLDEALTKLDSDQKVRLILNKAQYSWKRGHYSYGDYGYKNPDTK